MKKVYYLFLIVLLLTNISAPATGHGMREAQFVCPICGTKDHYFFGVITGNYIYHSPSRFQYLFWPLTEPESLWVCQKCHLTCLMRDFNKIPKEQISKIKKALEGAALPAPVLPKNIDNASQQGSYRFIPMSARIPVAERVYNVLCWSDDFWCLFYRMAAYHYDMEDMPEKASEARRKALEYAVRLIADKSREGLLKESYLISGAMRHFLGDFAGARKDFEKGKAATYNDPSVSADEAKVTENYLNDLLDQFLNSPGEEIDLILAIDSGKSQRAAEILDRNPDLVRKSVEREGFERDEDGTPLHFAVRRGKLDMMRLLISRGADVNAKNTRENSPLFLAIEYFMGDAKPLDLMKLLLDSGADIQARGELHMTPLIFAVRFFSKHEEGDEAIFLISRGAEVNVKDEDSMTPLHYAIKNKNEKLVKLLIAHGADVSAKNKKGETPMMCARKADLKDIVELLRKHGAKE